MSLSQLTDNAWCAYAFGLLALILGSSLSLLVWPGTDAHKVGTIHFSLTTKRTTQEMNIETKHLHGCFVFYFLIVFYFIVVKGREKRRANT